MSSSSPEPEQDKPHDLSMKKSSSNSSGAGHQRKVKHIPPPLDLNAHTLVEHDHHLNHGAVHPASAPGQADVRVPKSPNELPRECLPIRKRHLVEAGGGGSAFHSKSPKSAGPDGITFRLSTPVDLSSTSMASNIRTSIAAMLPTAVTSLNGRHTAPNSPLVTNSSLSLTPSSATSSNHPTFTHFPVPPPLIPVPQGSGNAVAAVAMAAMANAFNNSKAKVSSASHSGFPTPPTDVPSPYAWTHSPFAAAVSPFSPLPLSPFPMTSLLSPTASHPSSLSSSREDVQNAVEREMIKRRLLPASAGGHFDAPPASPLWSFGGTPIPTPVWQCFQVGCRIKFLLPTTDAPWQNVQELAWKDHVAMKIDARNSYQYAPNGLVLVQADENNKNHSPEEVTNKSNSGQNCEALLRFSPAHLSGAPDILVEAPITHPFLVKDKGWCSLNPTVTSNQYGIRCHDLSVGDICLPPNHPEAIRTPDLCDRFKRFEFSSPASADDLASPRAIQGGSAFVFGANTGVAGSTSTNSSSAKGSPPPPSPAKKKEKDCDKPKRPMNGFMLFAKKYRLELIQQHPGKDNRAISVLLGEAWKSLPLEERESYSTKAKVMADEQKKIYPDCWKRKKTVASSGGGTPSSGSSSNANHGETSLTIKNSTQTSLQMPPLIHQQPPPPLEVVANSAAQRMDTSLDIV